MASSKLLKERIESIQDTMKITNAMYLISSSKLRKARQNYQNVLPYFTRMRDTISRVVPHLPDEPEHPFFHERDLESPKRAYIVLTADKGDGRCLQPEPAQVPAGARRPERPVLCHRSGRLPCPVPQGSPSGGGFPLRCHGSHPAARP